MTRSPCALARVAPATAATGSHRRAPLVQEPRASALRAPALPRSSRSRDTRRARAALPCLVPVSDRRLGGDRKGIDATRRGLAARESGGREIPARVRHLERPPVAHARGAGVIPRPSALGSTAACTARDRRNTARRAPGRTPVAERRAHRSALAPGRRCSDRCTNGALASPSTLPATARRSRSSSAAWRWAPCCSCTPSNELLEPGRPAISMLAAAAAGLGVWAFGSSRRRGRSASSCWRRSSGRRSAPRGSLGPPGVRPTNGARAARGSASSCRSSRWSRGRSSSRWPRRESTRRSRRPRASPAARGSALAPEEVLHTPLPRRSP